jgi:hypothetical protein
MMDGREAMIVAPPSGAQTLPVPGRKSELAQG